MVSQGLFTASQLHLVGIVFKGENRAGVLSEKTFSFQVLLDSDQPIFKKNKA